MNIHILVGFARILRKCSTSFVQSFFQVEKLFSLSFRLPNPEAIKLPSTDARCSGSLLVVHRRPSPHTENGTALVPVALTATNCPLSLPKRNSIRNNDVARSFNRRRR